MGSITDLRARSGASPMFVKELQQERHALLGVDLDLEATLARAQAPAQPPRRLLGLLDGLLGQLRAQVSERALALHL